jgi:protoporphyrinogen oxidase
MKRLETETLIIGAGPAGMACAMELSKKDRAFVCIERDILVGGLSKTYKYTEDDGSIFYTDNGPHRFFSKNPYLYEFIGNILNEDWVPVKRQTRQYIDGKYYDYPINALQALKNVGVMRATKMMFDYVLAKIRYGLFRKPIRNFEDYVVAHFGRALGQFNMINYTEKIWGIPASEIHPDWAKQRIKGLDLVEVVKDIFLRLFHKKSVTAKSLVDTFYYPHKGTGQIYEQIKNILESKGYDIKLSTSPISVTKTKDGFVTTVTDNTGDRYEIASRYIVESVPIHEFINLLGRTVPPKVRNTIRRLRYRSQVYLFLTLNKKSISDDQWIYLPAKDVPIGRVSEMKNFSPYMSPADKTSLFVELFCFEGDDVWNMKPAELFEYILPFCEQAGFFDRSHVRQYYHIAKKNVYPIYDLSYKDYLGTVKNYLDTIQGLYFIGRPGRFRYNNQDHSLEMGILAAKSIVDGVKYDIEAVGEEKEYFEKGALNSKQ